jgi:type IV pilus assembly protein PilO
VKLHFSKRDSIILGFGTLLLVLLIILAQFVYLSPLKTDLSANQQTLKSEEKLLEIEIKKKAVTASTTIEDTRELQKKVPVKPLEDAFILDLEKAETLSNSDIKSMSFSKDADVAADNNQAAANGQTNNTTAQNSTAQSATTQGSSTTQGASTTQGSATGAAAQTPATSATPAGMKKLTVNLSVESPTYEDLEKFIQTLESLTRIVVVESINYTGGQEITSLDQEAQKLTYSLTVSAFYMPNLADLQDQVPNIDAPAPANKENPLSQFSDTTNSN